MSETKWTPGKWEYDCEWDFIIDDDGYYICSMDIGYSCSEMEEKEANAPLIAASPDLYEALEDVIGLIPLEFEQSPMVAFAKESLAKARGETQA